MILPGKRLPRLSFQVLKKTELKDDRAEGRVIFGDARGFKAVGAGFIRGGEKGPTFTTKGSGISPGLRVSLVQMRFQRPKIGLCLSTYAAVFEQEVAFCVSGLLQRRYGNSNGQLATVFQCDVMLLQVRGRRRLSFELSEENELKEDLAILSMRTGGAAISKLRGQTERTPLTTSDMMRK